LTEMVIRPSGGWRALNPLEVWRYRELMLLLAWRDVRVRYKQTALGAAWAILQPVAAMAIFTLFLGVLVAVPSDGLPYGLFVYAGLLPWMYFTNAVTAASGSLVGNASLISKVYFPRLIIPLASVLPGLVDLAIGFLVLLLFAAVLGVTPTSAILLMPIFVLLAVLTALAVGVWLSALDVKYRDVRHAVPFLVQVWMFATPVVYPASLVPEAYRALYGLNPMAGVVEGFRWSLFGHTPPNLGLLVVSTVTVTAVLGTGLLYFRRMERAFADVI
jgi:lipopolysaccharide transport system permease protein